MQPIIASADYVAVYETETTAAALLNNDASSCRSRKAAVRRRVVHLVDNFAQKFHFRLTEETRYAKREFKYDNIPLQAEIGKA